MRSPCRGCEHEFENKELCSRKCVKLAAYQNVAVSAFGGKIADFRTSERRLIFELEMEK